MTLYKILIENRNYENYDIYNANTLDKETIFLEKNIVNYKLFNNDTFYYDNNNLILVHSSIRNVDNIPGVLILENNKNYGKVNIKNKGQKSNIQKSKKYYYKVIPDDIRIPIFLIDYEIKENNFIKIYKNQYITFRFSHWNENDKHPYGKLNQLIGSIDILNNFYEYQLYCKCLNISIQKFIKNAKKEIEKTIISDDNNINNINSHNKVIENICNKNDITISRNNIENRINNDYFIFSIDPINSQDYDDAFSILELENNKYLLSIYISNVSIIMDYLNLWDSFCQRISTIYLPDRKRPMLPTILSDCLCSLQENRTRIALTMDINLELSSLNDEIIINSINYKNTIIKVNKNFNYHSEELLTNNNYLLLFKIVIKLCQKYRLIKNIINSQDVVSYLMIFMNYNVAKELLIHKEGLYRTTITNKEQKEKYNLNYNKLQRETKIIPNEINNFFKMWTSSFGCYVNYEILNSVINENENENENLDLIDLNIYSHITSPIRRLIDLLNMIKFQQLKNLYIFNNKCDDFYNNWINKLDYINTTMRAIKKIQNDCNLLDKCINNTELLEKEYDGFCFDKLNRNDGLFQYIVYLPSLNLTSKLILLENLNNFEKRKYKLYIFNNEEKFKKKIRLQLV